jgi:hypothetical protein
MWSRLVNEGMPKWLQTMAIGVLTCAFLGAHAWVWEQQRTADRSRYAIEDATYNILYFALPVPILFLGARYCIASLGDKSRGEPVDSVLFMAVLALVLPALVAVCWGAFVGKGPRVRESGNWASRPAIFPVDAVSQGLSEAPV